MDEVDDNDLSDFSNPEAPDVIGDTTTSNVVPNVNHTSINNANAIVTCTVTTGLTPPPNGVNNGKSTKSYFNLLNNFHNSQSTPQKIEAYA